MRQKRKFCVFCGAPPSEKSREHVLPQWLLRMTGDPRRVVKFGINYEKNRVLEFSWQGLVIPACADCNNTYSQLEADVQPILERLLGRESVSGAAYLKLFDWLDKVRVGLWLVYHLLQGNPTRIEPTFHINQRIGAKDRFLAIYPLSDQIGLNALGVESLVFHRMPSCFGLRVNSLLILNASADYLFAARCGFPFPKTKRLRLFKRAPAKLLLGNFETTRRVKSPIFRKHLHKPCVLLFQPIMQRDVVAKSRFLGEANAVFDSFIAEHTLPPYPSGKGVLFRQFLERVEVIKDMSQCIDFDSITGSEGRTGYELWAQIYDLQNYTLTLSEPTADEPELIQSYLRQTKLLLESNRRLAKWLRRPDVHEQYIARRLAKEGTKRK